MAVRTKDQKTKKNDVVIYQAKSGAIELRGDFGKETIWATQAQIADLFAVDRTVVTKHINNILGDKEIDEKSNVQKMHIPDSDRPVKFYSLDLILAVGYRTNSGKAIKFRQWATQTLREYLLKGLVINADRIKKLPDRILQDLDQKISFIQRTIKKRELDQSETDSLLSVIHDYANSWRFLKEFDEAGLVLQRSSNKEKRRLEYDFVRTSINALKNDLLTKGEASDLLVPKETDHLGVFLKRFIRHSMEKSFIPALKKRLLICCTSLSKIILFQAGINESAHLTMALSIGMVGTQPDMPLMRILGSFHSRL